MQQALLLPPATGVEWASPSSKHSRSHGNATSNGPGSTHSEKARQQPLFDPDPAHQVSMETLVNTSRTFSDGVCVCVATDQVLSEVDETQ